MNFTEQPHFELHFKAEHYVHYEASADNWTKAKWSELISSKTSKALTIANELTSSSNAVKRIQYNTKKLKKYIILDVDNENLFAYKDANLPNPNFILKNKTKPGGHLFYVLDRTISHDYFTDIWKQVQKSFSIQSGADILNKGFIGKNINNSKDFDYIEIEPKAYDILYLMKFVNQTQRSPKKPLKKAVYKQKQLITTTGRNVEIFDKLRIFAYAALKKSVNNNDFKLIVASQASKINNSYQYPLKEAELQDIVKSITEYCIKNSKAIKNYKQKRKLNLNMNLNLKAKQKIGAEHTNKIQNAKTEAKIKVALIDMKKQGLKINVSSVAKFTELSRPTITKYKHFLK